MRPILRTSRSLGPEKAVDELALPLSALLGQQLEAVRQPQRAQEAGEANRRRLRDVAVARPAREEEADAGATEERRVRPREARRVVSCELGRSRVLERPVAERREVPAPRLDAA